MIPTFVIFLREGVEASMIVAILLSYLDQIGQRRHFRDIFLGVAAAVVLMVAGGVTAYLAVGREGLETMVFTLAIVFASTHQAPTAARGHGLLLGALLGLVMALGIAYAIFKLGKRLNIGLFFRVVGIVLMVFAAGLLADAIQNMQKLGWLPFLDHAIWNTSSYLSESSSIGDVFHSLLGYAEQPTVLQAIVWVTYLGVATTAFIVMGRRGRAAAPVVSVVPT